MYLFIYSLHNSGRRHEQTGIGLISVFLIFNFFFLTIISTGDEVSGKQKLVHCL